MEAVSDSRKASKPESLKEAGAWISAGLTLERAAAVRDRPVRQLRHLSARDQEGSGTGDSPSFGLRG